MVIANDGANFSVGANLGELAYAAQSGQFNVLEEAIHNFQKTVQLIRYSSKPVVTAIKGKVLGGGCEISMGAANVIASAESYIGLVELGVGLIPAGTGTMHMVARAGEKAATAHTSHVQPFIQQAFETIAMAKVATSAHEAIELGYLLPQARISMHDERRIHVAREEVIRLWNQGYLPPAVRTKIFVPGKPGLAPLETAAWMMHKSGWITEYDAFLAKRLAYIMCGGTLNGPDYVHEDYLIDLEREVFLSLLGEKKTQDRVHSILTTNKPLRN
jgi:3-hydroxyacyl-CoA dehydrogenase